MGATRGLVRAADCTGAARGRPRGPTAVHPAPGAPRAPRLFDETHDWLARNGSLVSTHRLRSVATGTVDRSLIEASLDWTAAQRRRAKAQPAEPREAATLEPLFAALDVPEGRRDPHVAHHGWAR